MQPHRGNMNSGGSPPWQPTFPPAHMQAGLEYQRRFAPNNNNSFQNQPLPQNIQGAGHVIPHPPEQNSYQMSPNTPQSPMHNFSVSPQAPQMQEASPPWINELLALVNIGGSLKDIILGHMLRSIPNHERFYQQGFNCEQIVQKVYTEKQIREVFRYLLPILQNHRNSRINGQAISSNTFAQQVPVANNFAQDMEQYTLPDVSLPNVNTTPLNRHLSPSAPVNQTKGAQPYADGHAGYQLSDPRPIVDTFPAAPVTHTSGADINHVDTAMGDDDMDFFQDFIDMHQDSHPLNDLISVNEEYGFNEPTSFAETTTYERETLTAGPEHQETSPLDGNKRKYGVSPDPSHIPAANNDEPQLKKAKQEEEGAAQHDHMDVDSKMGEEVATDTTSPHESHEMLAPEDIFGEHNASSAQEADITSPQKKKPSFGANRLVCVGIMSTFATCYVYPNHGTMGANAKSIPRIPVTVRDARHRSGLLFTIYDGQSQPFARLHPPAARFFKMALDTFPQDFKLDALRLRIRERPNEGDEKRLKAGDSFRKILRMDVHLNVRYWTADQILGFAGACNLMLKEPTGNMEHYKPELIQTLPVDEIDSNEVLRSQLFHDRFESHDDNLLGEVEDSSWMPELDQPAGIITKLYPHQKQGLWFMSEREKNPFVETVHDKLNIWEAIVTEYEDGTPRTKYYNRVTGTESDVPAPQSLGGIIADDMGLGKTLLAISHIAATKDAAFEFSQRRPQVCPVDRIARKNVKGTLLVVKMSLLDSTWVAEIEKHTKSGILSVYTYYGKERNADLSDYDVVLTTYETLRNESRKRTESPLFTHNWFREIADEAHFIRNFSSGVTQALLQTRAERRWALSGTPIQNKLGDLATLIAYLKVHPLEHPISFDRCITWPWMQQCDEHAVYSLKMLLRSVMLRRTKEALIHLDVPGKVVQKILLDFEPKDREFYDELCKHYDSAIKKYQQEGPDLSGKAKFHIFAFIMKMRQFCAHKQEMLGEAELKLINSRLQPIDIDDSEGMDEDAVEKAAEKLRSVMDVLGLLVRSRFDECIRCHQYIYSNSPSEERPEDAPEEAILPPVLCHMTACNWPLCDSCNGPYAEAVEYMDVEKRFINCKECPNNHLPATIPIMRDDFIAFMERDRESQDSNRLARARGGYITPSVKVKYLIKNLQHFKEVSDKNPNREPHKAVVFSEWTKHLDQIEIALDENEIKFVRLDGTMNSKKRTAAVKAFQENRDIRVFLITTGAGGVGITLTAANFVFLMEPGYNPMAEQQAIDRVHRIGQRRKVTVVRFIMRNTFEEGVLAISHRKEQMVNMAMQSKMGSREERKKQLDELLALFKKPKPTKE